MMHFHMPLYTSMDNKDYNKEYTQEGMILMNIMHETNKLYGKLFYGELNK